MDDTVIKPVVREEWIVQELYNNVAIFLSPGVGVKSCLVHQNSRFLIDKQAQVENKNFI